MGKKSNNLKETIDTVKSGTKAIKNVTKSAALVKKGVGTGIKILDELVPEAGQKVHDVMDSIQKNLEDHEEDFDKVVQKLQTGFDRVIGDRIEEVVDKIEAKIEEKGGKQLETKLEGVVEKVESVVAPILNKGKIIASDGSKEIIKKVLKKK